MIPYGRQYISQADIDAVVDVLRSDWITQGPAVPRFEQVVAAYVGVEHGVAVNSATSALHIACLALGVAPGDYVWTSPNTFVASANCALYCGASVDFVDVDERTYNMSIRALADKLLIAKDNGRLPKVVIPVHYSGQSCDMAGIRALSKEYGFKVIEDASHAIGGKYRNEAIGNCRYSDITIFSFHPVKIITSGEGGMAMTSCNQLASIMRQLRSHGLTTERTVMHPRSDSEIWNYQQTALGFNYRMTDIHAALGLSQSAHLDEFVLNRHKIAERYDQALANLPVILPWQQDDALSSYHLYPIRIRQADCGRTQRQIYEAFIEAKVGVNIHYIPVYRQPYYEALGFAAGYCPESEAFHREAISLPIFPRLTESEQDYVINVLKNALL
jgi:UDP-4-amino-4,6-dideoxy-N-acetyl-beta-L-altrosamine transaminase